MVVSINQILNPFLFGTARSLKYYLSDVIDRWLREFRPMEILSRVATRI